MLRPTPVFPRLQSPWYINPNVNVKRIEKRYISVVREGALVESVAWRIRRLTAHQVR
jgi:hypothetical protein